MKKILNNSLMIVVCGAVVFVSSFVFAASTADGAAVAELNGKTQTVVTSLGSREYIPIVVQKGIKVKWIINANANNINYCNSPVVVPEYGLKINLKPGENVIEFMPEKTGVVPFSCWMGMINSSITVVDDIKNPISVSAGEKNDGSVKKGPSKCGGCNMRFNF